MLQVDVDALHEDTHGVLRVDHVQLRGSAAMAQLFALAREGSEAREALSARVVRSQLAWRFVDGAARWLPAAFEVGDADGIEPLVADILPEARPLDSLDGFANEEGAIVRLGERTFVIGDLQTIRSMIDVGASVEVTWPSNRPAVEGWLGFDTPQATTENDAPTTVGGPAVIHRAEIAATLDGEAFQLAIDMASPDPEALAVRTRTMIEQFRQSSGQGIMRILMRATTGTMFEDAQIEVSEASVGLRTSMTPPQAELLLSYLVFTIGRSPSNP